MEDSRKRKADDGSNGGAKKKSKVRMLCYYGPSSIAIHHDFDALEKYPNMLTLNLT
jgi:hypothetical protein